MTSKYSLMYDELVKGNRLLVPATDPKLLRNKLHQVTSKLRKQATELGYELPPFYINILKTDSGLEVWSSDKDPTPPPFTVISKPEELAPEEDTP